MFKLFVSVFFVILVIPLFVRAQNQVWYFPIWGYENRNQYKTFNQYIDKAFYNGRQALFPTQFTGYHVGDDLEINPGEESQNVPVYAVSDGKITFAGQVGGYGGVILLDIANDSHTALYGHISLSSLKVKAGDTVKAGQELAYLGKGFSSETAGERKHLHFAIYNGKGVYYHGYETSEAVVQSKWVDPEAYLKQKGAVDYSSQLSVPSVQKENGNQNVVTSDDSANANDKNTNPVVSKIQPNQTLPAPQENIGFFSKILQYLKEILNKI